MAKRVKQFEALATELVGDGNRPNLFFLSVKGNILLITSDFNIAYDAWKATRLSLSKIETAIEDRQNGLICQYGDVEDERGNLVYTIIDDSTNFGLR